MDFGSMKDKAEKLIKGHGKQADEAVDKAEEIAKDKIKGHDAQIDQAAAKVKDVISDEQ